MFKITLTWKEFETPVDRLAVIIKNLIGVNYNGLICNQDNFDVVFNNEPSQQELNDLNEFWNNATEQQFSPTLREIISNSINNAAVFGQSLILDAAVENVEMGITQAGMTRQVADYCADIQRYLQSGSLYAALSEIDDLITAGVPVELSPYITEARLLDYKQRIEDYLGI